MKRTTLFLTDFQLKKLNEITIETEIKFSELVRRAIDLILKKYNKNAN